MEHTPLVSSTLKSAGYDSGTMTMEVAFVNESVYQYFDVPEHIFNGLITAASAGTYFNSNVKGAYRYSKL